MGKAAQTQARLIDQRARRRADQALKNNHRQEWDRLYYAFVAEAEAEAVQIAAAAPAPTHVHTDVPSAPPEPPRLKPGARLAGQSVIDRIDVARCNVCVKYHDRGHRCAQCGKVAPVPTPLVGSHMMAREVHRLFDAGTKVEIIAATLRIKPDLVERLLDT